MHKGPTELRWGVEQRLEFIEFRLLWEGGVNRADIMRYFSVSVPQASKDLSQYQEIAPENIRYDRREKKYFAADGFEPRFLKPDADTYFSQLRLLAEHRASPDETWLSQIPSFDAVALPRRNVDTGVLLSVLRAVRAQRSVEIRYQSLSSNRPKAIWRRITPHAFGYDGHRWHVRAFCHLDRQFKDFLLPRILGTRDDAPAEARQEDDHVWKEFVTVVLKPHPDLNEEQQQVIAQDFCMKGKKLSLEVRLALIYYFLKRLNLDFHEEQRPAREQHVVLGNREEVKSALARAQYIARA